LLTNILTDNSLADWIVAGSIFVATVVVVKMTVAVVASKIASVAARTETELDDVIVRCLQNVKLISVLGLGLYLASLSLILPSGLNVFLQSALILILLFQGGLWSNALLDHILMAWAEDKFRKDPTITTALGSIGFLTRCGVWSIFLMLALGNIGVDVGPLVASLGIGGIAFALALQNVLGDLFGSFTIVFDKPFVVGDYIEIGGFEGTVRTVGLKSTRIEALSGEQLVLANSDLLSGRIRNFNRRDRRRVNFIVTVTYDTPSEKIQRIPEIIQGVIDAEEKAVYDRSFLKRLGDYGIDFEVVYYIKAPDLGSFGVVNHNINMEILKRFAIEEIGFARRAPAVTA
tara:strand:+ start:1321 stop:2355 length:1035 start_codon:yes stop_codon:yes gene_type:complete